MLRLAFSTSEPAAPGRRAAMLGYRVHIHKERTAKGASPDSVLFPDLRPKYAKALQGHL